MLVGRDDSVLDHTLDYVAEMGERTRLVKLSSITENISHTHHRIVRFLSSLFSRSLIQPQCNKEHYHRFFIPSAITLFNLKIT